MKTMGLDLSLLATGLCVLDGDPDGRPEIHTQLLARSKAPSTLESIKRLTSISSEILSVIGATMPDCVVIEAAAMNQKWRAAEMGELHGVVKKDIYTTFGIVPVVAQATKMRTLVVGKIERSFEKSLDDSGKVKKRVSYGSVTGKSGKKRRATVKDVIESRLLERGLSFPTQDEMDAYVAAMHGWMLIGGRQIR